MKKILLLGGSAQQVIAIKTAKRLGYYTVLCDFLTDNPGQCEADKFYLVSTTEKKLFWRSLKRSRLMGYWHMPPIRLRLQQLMLQINLVCQEILINLLKFYAIKIDFVSFC